MHLMLKVILLVLVLIKAVEVTLLMERLKHSPFRYYFGKELIVTVNMPRFKFFTLAYLIYLFFLSEFQLFPPYITVPILLVGNIWDKMEIKTNKQKCHLASGVWRQEKAGRDHKLWSWVLPVDWIQKNITSNHFFFLLNFLIKGPILNKIKFSHFFK